mmetsp:Transcript_95490/g.270046  ORF Transcript_95490/g.270046 Transcript_95490/m.270046 type:complete len:323 (-) Transcript_95490:568-1536(-)
MQIKYSLSFIVPEWSTSTKSTICLQQDSSIEYPNQFKMCNNSFMSISPELSVSKRVYMLRKSTCSSLVNPSRLANISMTRSNSARSTLPVPSSSTSLITSSSTYFIGSTPKDLRSASISLTSTKPDWSTSTDLKAFSYSSCCRSKYLCTNFKKSDSRIWLNLVMAPKISKIHSEFGFATPMRSRANSKSSLWIWRSSCNFSKTSSHVSSSVFSFGISLLSRVCTAKSASGAGLMIGINASASQPPPPTDRKLPARPSEIEPFPLGVNSPDAPAAPAMPPELFSSPELEPRPSMAPPGSSSPQSVPLDAESVLSNVPRWSLLM